MVLLPKYTVLSPDAYGRTDWDDGKKQEYDVLICSHCDRELHVVPGLLQRRGRCGYCGAKTCGEPTCSARPCPRRED